MLRIRIFEDPASLPPNWDFPDNGNLFLSRRYFESLAESGPENMRIFAIGYYADDRFCGKGIAQFLKLERLESFGERDRCLKTGIRDWLFRNFSSHALFLGNTMLSGQNAIDANDPDDFADILEALKTSAKAITDILKKEGIRVHLTTYKDFYPNQADVLLAAGFRDHYHFSTQPAMVLQPWAEWRTMDDYVKALNKKYRDQYKRARKKHIGITSRPLTEADLELLETPMYDLYRTVAKNAPFNTFFLSRNHFASLKRHLGADFYVQGYFLDNQLIGYLTLIHDGSILETYFLGYDDAHQRERMLYLNMLYDMIGYAIQNGFKKINFARTALEIKSGVGAVPEEMSGFMRHSNKLIDAFLPRLFKMLEPELSWQQRHPFKD